jgi:hypothetical protein
VKKDWVNISLVAIIGCCLGFFLIYWYFAANPSPSAPLLQSTQNLNELSRKKIRAVPLSQSEKKQFLQNQTSALSKVLQSPVDHKVLSAAEKASVALLVDEFLVAWGKEVNPGMYIQSLKSLGLKPQLAVDANPYTGAMAVIRSVNALPGTRYFHVQMMGDDKASMHMQSISFEVRAAKDSEKSVIEALQKTFSGLGEPSYEREGFKEWRLQDCLIVWIKVLGENDLKDHPLNAYNVPKDIGTLRVTQEEDQHCHEVADSR